jgi:hypothetical protein
MISDVKLLFVLLPAFLASPLSAQSVASPVSGIVRYTFEPNPKEIKRARLLATLRVHTRRVLRRRTPMAG